MTRVAWTIVALALLPAIGEAAEWVRVPAPDGNRHWYDRTKVVTDGDVVTYWRMVDFRTPQPSKSGAAISAMYRESIDCHGHTHRTLGYLLYGQDRSIIENVHTPDSEAEPVIPETVGDRYERVMCRIAPQVAAEQRNAVAASIPPTREEIRQEIDFLEARLRMLRDQLDVQNNKALPPVTGEPPAIVPGEAR